MSSYSIEIIKSAEDDLDRLKHKRDEAVQELIKLEEKLPGGGDIVESTAERLRKEGKEKGSKRGKERRTGGNSPIFIRAEIY